ncbi:MAG: CheR family methyltransferase [Planctomycetota bacterium]
MINYREKMDTVLSKVDFDKFRQYIESRAGMYIDDSKKNSLKISLDARMNILGIKDYSAYYSLITTNAFGRKEFDELLYLVLIKETFFFRDDKQLQVLTKNILPELIEREKEKEIKIWSAGCATGEEPYSIAMAIMASTLSGGFNANVYATDICKEALERAREGVYNKSSVRAIDKEMLNKYFTPKEGRYYLNDQVKQLVRFDTVNLIEPYFPMEGNLFDVIFCKNVIIYFRIDTVKAVIRRFYDVLTTGGYLFVGHSESLWQISDDFELEEISGVFLYRKNRKSNVVVPSTKWLPQAQIMCQGVGERGQKIGVKIPATVSYPSTPVKKLTTKKSIYGKRDLSELIKKGLQPSADIDYDSILENIEEVLIDEPRNLDAHLLAGKIYANMGLYDKALKKSIDALEINDLCAEAYLLIGSIYYKIGEKGKAVSPFKKAIYLDDKSVLSHYYLGNLYKDSNLTEQAIREYKNVINILDTNVGRGELLVGEVFTVTQLKEICAKNIEILSSKEKQTTENIK